MYRLKPEDLRAVCDPAALLFRSTDELPPLDGMIGQERALTATALLLAILRVKPAPFEYHDPRTVDEAVALLKQYDGEAKVLAGGHSLLPAMKLRVAQPRVSKHLNVLRQVNLVTVRGDGPAAVRAARTGVELDDGWVKPLDIRARNVSRGLWELEITIAEGHTREVRRLCEALGLGVERLVRTQFGPVRLGDLPPGATRALTGRERDIISAIVR